MSTVASEPPAEEPTELTVAQRAFAAAGAAAALNVLALRQRFEQRKETLATFERLRNLTRG